MNSPDKPIDPAVEQAFLAVSGLQGLRQPAEQVPVMFAELVCYLLGSGQVDGARVEQAINSDLTCRRQFQKLLQSRRLGFVAREARADDGSEIASRESKEFNVVWRTSNADPRQTYVILRVTPDCGIADGSAVALLVNSGSVVKRIEFSPLQDAKTQAILLSEDERLHLLRTADAEVSLVALP